MEATSSKKNKLHKTSTKKVPRKKKRRVPAAPSIEKTVLKHNKISCDLCPTPFKDFDELQKHYRQIHKKRGYMRCCKRKIYKRCWMIEHLQIHLNPDTFHCETCNKSYSSSRVLKEHMKEVHASSEERSVVCETCQKTFVSRSHLYAHELVAHGSVPCPQCPKILSSQGSLKKHLISMHGEGEQHICNICARVYRTKKCYDTHMQRHWGTRLEGKMQCDECLMWFTDKNCLNKHIRRMHTILDAKLPCELCDKQFNNQDALNCHMYRTHSESRYECQYCYKKFKREHHMKEHVAIHHTGEDLYECNYCAEKFNSKNKHYTHRKTVHPIEFEQELRKRVLKLP